MKICKACSAYNSDDRTYCVDCGQRLGAPLNEEEAAVIQQALQENTNKLCNGQDPTHVNGYDLVLGCLQGIGLVAALLFWVLGLVQADCVPYMVGALVAFFVGAGTCFAPGFLWEITAWYRSFWTHDTQPFIFTPLFRRLLETVVFLAGVALTVWSILG